MLLLDFSTVTYAHGDKNNIDVSIARGLWLKTENTLKVYSYLYLSVNRSAPVTAIIFSWSIGPQDPETIKFISVEGLWGIPNLIMGHNKNS